LYEDSELKEERTSLKSQFNEDSHKVYNEIKVKLPFLDFNLLENEYSIENIYNLNTEITPFQIQPIIISIIDISLYQERLSTIPSQFDTNYSIFTKKEVEYKIADIIISSMKQYEQIRDYDTSIIEVDLSKTEEEITIGSDFVIQEEIKIKSVFELDTNIYLSDLENDIINDFFAGSLAQLPLFE